MALPLASGKMLLALVLLLVFGCWPLAKLLLAQLWLLVSLVVVGEMLLAVGEMLTRSTHPEARRHGGFQLELS